MGKLIEHSALRNQVEVFRDRYEAGRVLGKELMHYKDADAIVLAIPSGGVPVASEIARLTGLPMDLAIVRKLQIPGNPEAGFGALGPDGETMLNESLVRELRLSLEQIQEQIERTLRVMEQRSLRFRRAKPYPRLKGRCVIVVDDGLASGYTMIAAIRWVRKMAPKKAIVAVPTGSERTIERVLPEVDEIICLNVRSSFPFAVADAYRSWYDLSDAEVLKPTRSRPPGMGLTQDDRVSKTRQGHV